MYFYCYSIFWEEVGNGIGPFDDDEIVGVADGFGEVICHEARVGEAVEVVVDEGFATWEGVGFADGETGAGDGLRHAEATC